MYNTVHELSLKTPKSEIKQGGKGTCPPLCANMPVPEGTCGRRLEALLTMLEAAPRACPMLGTDPFRVVRLPRGVGWLMPRENMEVRGLSEVPANGDYTFIY